MEDTWACTLCTFLNPSITSMCQMCGSPNTSPTESPSSTLPVSLGPPLVSEGALLVRQMEDDNSCCFAAISYCMYGNRSYASDLRETIAGAAGSDPNTWNAATLGKPVGEYQAWIRKPTSWGGGIELALMASHFQVEIAVMDAQTTRMDLFGTGSGYDSRIYVLYTGIHYDALAWAPSQSAPESGDTRIFSPLDTRVEDAAVALVAGVNAQHGFTDTASFALFCQDCGTILRGQTAAVEHAKATAHSAFVEYKE